MLWWTSLLVACPRDERPPDDPGPQPVRRWTGDEPFDEAGRSLAVGDPDRDGRADVLIGAPSSFIYGPDAARSHAGVYRVTEQTPDGVLAQVSIGSLTGEHNGDGFGYHIAVLGDVTGDDREDIAVEGLVDDTPIVAYLLYDGALSGSGTWDTFHSGFSVLSGLESASDLARCGDLDGDGVSEVCLGNDNSPFAAPLGDAFVKTHIFRGPIAAGLVPLASADVQLVGLNEDVAGFALEGGRDLTGDGLPDLLVGADNRDDSRGGVFVVSDPPDGISDLLDYPLWAGETPGEQAGWAAVGGDLDGDGTDDAFIGAHPASRGYVVTHPRGGPLGEAALRLSTSDPLDWFGSGAAIADLDGDGAADLAIGAPRNRYAGFDQPGRVAIYLGPVGRGEATDADADLVFGGSDAPDAFGLELAAGDTDGSGDAELIVGAPLDGSYAEGAGMVYLYHPFGT